VTFRPLVLCYHAVSHRWPDPLAVPVEALEQQLRMLLRAGMRPVPAAGVMANRRRTFHVTFDDAYRSVRTAVPVLERLGIPATVFVCSDHACSGRRLDVPELRDRMGPDPDELLTMSWETLRELAERGVEIGSHSASHAHLTELGDDELRHELAGSREQIEDELGRPCRFLSYPYGEDDVRVRAAAQHAGYQAAYTLRAHRRRAGAFGLPRVDVYGWDGMGRFAVKASPLWDPGLYLLHALRRQARGSAERVSTSPGIRNGRSLRSPGGGGWGNGG
jgi:peptidoglycan/xylan/chitin deacetylase (PgdA/CDA1 family)